MGDMLILSVGILFGCVVLYEGCKEIKKYYWNLKFPVI